jgi:cytochrome c-type biogenesis protein CcmH/NrfG
MCLREAGRTSEAADAFAAAARLAPDCRSYHTMAANLQVQLKAAASPPKFSKPNKT